MKQRYPEIKNWSFICYDKPTNWRNIICRGEIYNCASIADGSVIVTAPLQEITQEDDETLFIKTKDSTYKIHMSNISMRYMEFFRTEWSTPNEMF